MLTVTDLYAISIYGMTGTDTERDDPYNYSTDSTELADEE